MKIHKVKRSLKSILKKSKFISKLWYICKYLNGSASITTIHPIYFDGWKMANGTRTPWLNGGNNYISTNFYKSDLLLKNLVKTKKIYLTQFNQENVNSELIGLTWRHYIVYWSAIYAVQNTKSSIKNYAEFGVCDGLTAFFASQAAILTNIDSNFYLYDAWEGMREDLLTESEKTSKDSYSYLNVENTKNNLSFTNYKNYIYNKGYIPDVFKLSQNPESLVWIHIDLNSSMPTIHALNRFWDNLEKGGIVLFDDFAWPGYEETQTEIEKWCVDKKCNLFHLPTGQAILFKLY